MNLLPLDDPRWNDLSHRDWSARQTSAWVPNILAEHPERTDLFNDLWPSLCSEGTAWAVSYAAVPYAVEFARRVSPVDRFEYLFFVGLVAMCTCPESGDGFEIKPYLASDYEQALKLALRF